MYSYVYLTFFIATFAKTNAVIGTESLTSLQNEKNETDYEYYEYYENYGYEDEK